MSGRGPPEAVLRSVLWKLSAFLPDIVVLGGWVPNLHRMYGSGTNGAASRCSRRSWIYCSIRPFGGGMAGRSLRRFGRWASGPWAGERLRQCGRARPTPANLFEIMAAGDEVQKNVEREIWEIAAAYLRP